MDAVLVAWAPQSNDGHPDHSPRASTRPASAVRSVRLPPFLLCSVFLYLLDGHSKLAAPRPVSSPHTAIALFIRQQRLIAAHSQSIEWLIHYRLLSLLSNNYYYYYHYTHRYRGVRRRRQLVSRKTKRNGRDSGCCGYS